jgi:hypothetical protein
MGRELAIKLYLTYLTVRHDCIIRPKVVGTDDCGVPGTPPRGPLPCGPVTTDQWTRPLW